MSQQQCRGVGQLPIAVFEFTQTGTCPACRGNYQLTQVGRMVRHGLTSTKVKEIDNGDNSSPPSSPPGDDREDLRKATEYLNRP